MYNTTKPKESNLQNGKLRIGMASAAVAGVLLLTNCSWETSSKVADALSLSANNPTPITNWRRVSYDVSIDSNYFHNVQNEAIWVSNQLNIPYPFIMSQWFMETNMLGNPSSTMINLNNLGGIKKSDSLYKYDDLHSFAYDYARILYNDGIVNMQDFGQIVEKLHQGKYFGTESSESYGKKVFSILSKLRGLNVDYYNYYNYSAASNQGVASNDYYYLNFKEGISNNSQNAEITCNDGNWHSFTEKCTNTINMANNGKISILLRNDSDVKVSGDSSCIRIRVGEE